MIEQDEFMISVSASEIEDWLVNNISDKNKKLIAKVIIQNLKTTEVGIEQLYKAINGMERKYKFAKGQEIWINYDKTYNWRYDKDKMIQANLIYQDKVKATIIDIRPWLKEPYRISYKYIEKTDNNIHPEEQISEQQTNESSLHEIDNYPMDL